MDEYSSNRIRPAKPDGMTSKDDIHLETSTVPWHELQRLFASGVVLTIARELDLVEIAYQIAVDNEAFINRLLEDNKISPVSNEQARHWHADNSLLWSVVVKPWVLVQDKQAS